MAEFVTIDTINKALVLTRQGRGKAPRLASLAAFINRTFPEYEARMEDWSYTPDKTPNERTRWPGKTKRGKRLAVYDRENRWRQIFSHVPMEPYRHNSDVCRWIVKQLEQRVMS